MNFEKQYEVEHVEEYDNKCRDLKKSNKDDKKHINKIFPKLSFFKEVQKAKRKELLMAVDANSLCPLARVIKAAKFPAEETETIIARHVPVDVFFEKKELYTLSIGIIIDT